MDHYAVALRDRNEVLEYRDPNGLYRFNVRLVDKQWTVVLPGIKGEGYHPYELTDEEQDLILPRIKQYLEGKKYFGFIGPTYPVGFEHK
jgi:hypothetical protein